MDMIHQLPGALYRLRSARLPFSSFSVPSGNPFRISCADSHYHSAFLRAENAACNEFRLVFRESLKFEAFGSRDCLGFRAYFGRRGYDSEAERWNKTLLRRSVGSSGFVYDGRSLLVVAAGRSSNRKAREFYLRVSEEIGEGDSEELSGQHAQLKRHVKSQTDLSRTPRSTQGASDIAELNRWRFEAKSNQGGGESQQKSQIGGGFHRPKEDSSSFALRNAVSRTKCFAGKASSGKVVSGTSSSSLKRVGRSPRTSDDRFSRDRSSATYSSVNVVGSKIQHYSVAKETSILKGSSPGSRVSTKTMSTQQRAGNNKQSEKDRKLNQNEKKKEKHCPPESVLRRELNMCSKTGDVLRALELYDQSVADGTVKWNHYNFNIILYLCSSASLGTLTARKSGSDRAESERLRFSATEQAKISKGSACRDGGLELVDKENGESPLEDDGATSASTSIVLSPEVMEQVATRGFQVYEHMKRLKVPPNEATLTNVARLAVARGDGDLAFQMVKEMAALNLAPKLRSYSPALFTYCKTKAVKKAFEVDAHMLSAGVQPEEPELAALLQLCVDTGLAEEVYKLLHRLRVRFRALSPTTVAAIEQWFSQEAATLAGTDRNTSSSLLLQQAFLAGGGGWHGLGWLGEGEWKQEWTNIDHEGICLSCREKLVTIDLDPQETENFAQSLADLALTRETKSNDFKNFQGWLERNGPFDAIIDGANIGLFNQNFAQGGFNFYQLNAVVTALQDQGLAKKPPLIFLHHARTKFGAATTSQAQQLLNKWRSNNSLYTTPNGSNDDWYWMYAAVKNKCLLVTNDEMRDHLFQLLGTDFFPKWKERHQVRFTCTTRGPEFHLPPPYSIVIQESEKGAWHVPKLGGDDIEAPREWLCITRASISTASAPETSAFVETSETPIEFCSSSREIRPEGLKEEQNNSLSKSHSAASGTEEAGVRNKRTRLNPPSATLVRIRAADKRSENGPIVFEI